MADIATLGLAVDSAPVERGTLSLTRFAGAAKHAEAATKGMATGARGAVAAAASVAGASANAAGSLTREAAAARQAEAATRGHMVAANSNSAAAKNAGYQMRMMAQQLSQVAQQTQAGAGFLQALAIQLPDLALGFGTVGIALGVVAGILLPLIPAGRLTADALRAIADVLPEIAPYAVAAAAGLALLYAPAIVGGLTLLSEMILGVTARLAGLAIGFALANPGIAFVAGITAAVAAATIFRDELTRMLGVDIVDAAKVGANFVVNSFAAAFSDLAFIWNNFGDMMGAAVIGGVNIAIRAIDGLIQKATQGIDRILEYINPVLEAGGMDGIKPVSGNFKLGELPNPYSDRFAAANSSHAADIAKIMSQDRLGQFGAAIANGASAASGKLKELADWVGKVDEKTRKKRGGKSEEEKYESIIDGANRRIASLQSEYDALGMTEFAAAKLAYQTDMLNEAQRRGIELTAAQKAQISDLAGRMASLEIATQDARDAIGFAKDITGGFISDLRSGLEQGKGFWESFGKAALNVINKITDRLLDDLLDAIFKVNSAGSSGGGGFWGILGSLFGLGGGGGSGLGGLTWDSWAKGGYTGPGGKYEPAGTVHRGEYVFSAAATRMIGVANLDRAHKRAKGYAEGGYVDGGMPRLLSPSNQNAAQPIVYSPSIQIDARGAENGDDVRRAGQELMKQMRAEFYGNTKKALQQLKVNAGGRF